MELNPIPPRNELPGFPITVPAQPHQELLNKGLRLLRQLTLKRWWRRLVGWMRGHPARLLDLNEYRSQLVLNGSAEIGLMHVPIYQIIGTEGRSHDFDGSFHLKNNRLRSRWLSVALARQQGQPIPPVILILIRQHYFVRDGHNRISVACWMGDETIAARVIRWDVAGILPWMK
jgi:hypothetical protein